MEKFADHTVDTGVDALDDLVSEMEGTMVLSLDWDEAERDLQNAILLKLASNKPFRKHAMVDMLKKVWKLSSPVSYQMVEGNVLLVKFESAVDQARVLMGGPWSLDGMAVIIQRWTPGMGGEDFDNTRVNMFLQIHRLPYELRTDKFARKMAEKAGKIIEHEHNGSRKEARGGGEYMKYRIEVDTTKPIRSGMFLRRRKKDPIWISFRYEKLPMICFKCGRLDHDIKVCTVEEEKYKGLFGTWLRAELEIENVRKWPVAEGDSGRMTVASGGDETESEPAMGVEEVSSAKGKEPFSLETEKSSLDSQKAKERGIRGHSGNHLIIEESSEAAKNRKAPVQVSQEIKVKGANIRDYDIQFISENPKQEESKGLVTFKRRAENDLGLAQRKRIREGKEGSDEGRNGKKQKGRLDEATKGTEVEAASVGKEVNKHELSESAGAAAQPRREK